MTKAEIQEYTLRITQGNRTDLIVTTYDIILKYIADASEELKKQDKKKYKWNIKKANEFIAQLMGALDLQYEVSLQLFQLYRFAQKRLIEASYEETDKKLEDAIAFKNVSNMPARVKCALLAWHTIEKLI